MKDKTFDPMSQPSRRDFLRLGAATALGVAVFFGMVGVTFFGLVFTPTFYVVFRAVADRLPKPPRILKAAERPELAE